MIKLPTEPIPASVVDPRVLVLYSFPKVGKTPCLAQLDKCLILDLERGTDFISSTKVTVIGLTHKRVEETETEREYRHGTVDTKGNPKQPEYYLSEVITALRAGHDYKFLALDTMTTLEGWCEEDATYMYMASPQGKSFNKYTDQDYQESNGEKMPGTLKPKAQWASVLTLPKGAGYQYLRESFEKWVDYLRPLAPYLILTGHVKLTSYANKEGKEVETKDLDLTGKIKLMVTGLKADAVGYMYRSGDKNFISFIPSEDNRMGNRAPHLEGENLLISEKQPDKSIKVYWKNIYKELAK